MPAIGRTPHTHGLKDRRAARKRMRTPIERAASAAENRNGDAAGTIEECKWRKRAT